MLDLDADLLALTRSDLAVLHAYYRAEQALVAQRPPQSSADGVELEQTRWVVRIREIESVPPDRLAPTHGRLIALGYLQFQLQGRDASVVYRVTPEGREMLAAAADPSSAAAPVRRSA